MALGSSPSVAVEASFARTCRVNLASEDQNGDSIFSFWKTALVISFLLSVPLKEVKGAQSPFPTPSTS